MNQLIKHDLPDYCPLSLDWRVAANYPTPEDLTPEQWAWEFLRRNPAYLKDWEHFKNLPDAAKFDDGYRTNKIGKWRGEPMQGFPLDCFYTHPPALPGETIVAYQQRMTADNITEYDVLPYAHYMQRQYKLPFGVNNPDFPLAKYHQFTDEYDEDTLPPFILQDAEQYFSGSFDDFFRTREGEIEQLALHYKKQCASATAPLAMVFDALKPIDEQLKLAKQVLLDKRQWCLQSGQSLKKNKRVGRSIDLFPRYIRILDALEQVDAHTESERFDKIAAVIYPEKSNDYPDRIAAKSIEKNYKAAIQYRDSNYWLIPNKAT